MGDSEHFSFGPLEVARLVRAAIDADPEQPVYGCPNTECLTYLPAASLPNDQACSTCGLLLKRFKDDEELGTVVLESSNAAAYRKNN